MNEEDIMDFMNGDNKEVKNTHHHRNGSRNPTGTKYPLGVILFDINYLII